MNPLIDTSTPFKPFSAKKQKAVYFHAEELPGINDKHFSTAMHLFAGAAAGIAEHVCMFPIDTVKTRMQTLKTPSYTGVSQALRTIVQNESIRALYKGVTAVFMSAGPSHALYFATYESSKRQFSKMQSQQRNKEQMPSIVVTATSGILATVVHDLLSTPLDVVKQRMQLPNHNFKNIMQCTRCIFRREGLRAFYLSYPTTLLMNIPYTSIHFFAYETFEHLLRQEEGEKFKAWKHIVSGGAAGGLAAAASNPFDVIKTKLQTQGYFYHVRKYSGIADAAKDIYRTEGLSGFTRGVIPRVLYFIPSAAITWTTYKYIKHMYQSLDLIQEDDDHEHHHHDHQQHAHEKLEYEARNNGAANKRL